MSEESRSRRCLSPLILLWAACCPNGVTPGAALESLARAPRPSPLAGRPVTDVRFGYSIRDPYRFLEDMPRARSWIAAEDRRAAAFLARIDDGGLKKRVRELLEVGFVGNPRLAGGRVFYIKKAGGAEQARLYQLAGGKEQVIFDPADLGTRARVAWYHPSPSGRLVAVGVTRSGKASSEAYVKRTDTGQQQALDLSCLEQCSLAWLSDDSGFYYTRQPDPAVVNRGVAFHRLGEPVQKDKLVFSGDRARVYWPSVDLSPDNRHLTVVVETSFTNTEVFLVERVSGKTTALARGLNATTNNLRFAAGRLLALTTYAAPRGRIVTLDTGGSDPASWDTVVREQPGVLRRFEPLPGGVLCVVDDRAVSRLQLFDDRGRRRGEVRLPTLGSIERLDVNAGASRAVVAFQSFTRPDSLLAIDLSPSPKEAFPLVSLTAAVHLRPEDYVVRHLSYPSFDGTWVPMFLLRRKTTRPGGGPRPVLLHGYGAYGASQRPRFLPHAMAWVERGGVFGVANIRGGGELGERWHRAGMKNKKFQSFKDFEYAMRYLLSRRITSVDRLAIEGVSAGGLLMGGMMTSAPYLFSCATSSAGFFDLVRLTRYSNGKAHGTEFGDADSRDDIGYVLGYSPYHQVIGGVRYPAFFADAMENDPRAPWMHTAKFVAALQSATSSGKPILFRLRRHAGHGVGLTSDEKAEALADALRFVMSQIGDPLSP